VGSARRFWSPILWIIFLQLFGELLIPVRGFRKPHFFDLHYVLDEWFETDPWCEGAHIGLSNTVRVR